MAAALENNRQQQPQCRLLAGIASMVRSDLSLVDQMQGHQAVTLQLAGLNRNLLVNSSKIGTKAVRVYGLRVGQRSLSYS